MVYYYDDELMIRNIEEADTLIFSNEVTVQVWHMDFNMFLALLQE